MSEPVSISVAATHFRVSQQTVRRWIQEGAPCVTPGGVGRGHGAQLRIADVAAWRAARFGIVNASGADTMTKIEGALADVVRRDGGNGVPITVELGIPSQKAALLLAHIQERISRALKSGNAT